MVTKAQLWKKNYSISNLKNNSSIFYSNEMFTIVLSSIHEAKRILLEKNQTDLFNPSKVYIPNFSTSKTNSLNKISVIAPELILDQRQIEVSNKKPFVSICTVTCNRPEFLKIAERIVKDQDYPHELLEWVILDDSDEDNVYRPNSSIDLKVKYKKLQKKLPIGKKRNDSHSLCKGEIIIYFDDDDYYPPSRVSYTVNELLKSKKLIAGSTFLPILYISNFEAWISGPFAKNHATGNTFAFKKDLLSHTKFNDSCKCGEEKEFLKNYKIPMVQLDPIKTLIAIAHDYNTFGKEQMRQNPKKYNMKKIINEDLQKIIDRIKPRYKSIRKYY